MIVQGFKSLSDRFRINGRRIQPGEPTYIIAEMSANHGQDFDEAVRILRAAADAGADAVKLQTYTPDTLTLASRNQLFQIGKGTIWEGKSLHELYSEAHMPWDWQPKLMTIANELGMDLFSSAFDPSAVDFLEEMEVPAHKVASFELVDIPLIQKMARTGKPLIISTGMAGKSEIEEAVQAARQAGADQIALLKCTSAYPAPPDTMNLLTIPDMASHFEVPVGLSDHTTGIAVPVAAVALGACIVEKHLTLSRAVPGPDSSFSLEPHEFRNMVEAVRVAEKAIGHVTYGLNEGESAMRMFRRSLFVTRDVRAGEPVNLDNVRSVRPGHGLSPKYLDDVTHRQFAKDVPQGTPLSWDVLGEPT